MKTGILGGTFNPVHYGHLRIAEEVREAFRLDRVMFLPAATPPHKDVAAEVSFDHRLAMVRAAVADHPAFEVSDLEGERDGKSYSVHTLEILARRHPDDLFYFIMGMDSFLDITSWKEWRRLFALAHIVVTARTGFGVDDPQAALPVAVAGEFCYDQRSCCLRHVSGKSLVFLEETRLDISSTRLRAMVREGRSLRYLVPPSVDAYIRQQRLYL